MFNTTILESGFHFQTEVAGNTRLKIYVDEFIHTYMQMHNTAVGRLQEAGILDRYCRLLCSPADGAVRLRAYYSESAEHYESLPCSYADLLAMDIIYGRFNTGYEVPGWLMTYPPAMLKLALSDLEEAIVKHDQEHIRRYREDVFQEIDIIIPISKIAAAQDIYNFSLFHNVGSGHLEMEFTMHNQIGSDVTMVVITNTIKFDERVQLMSDDGVFSDLSSNLTFHVGRCAQLSSAHKLLFRVTYYTSGEEVNENDTSDTGEGISEENREVVHV